MISFSVFHVWNFTTSAPACFAASQSFNANSTSPLWLTPASAIIKHLSTDKDWTAIKLFENYRSTSDIVHEANRNSTYADPNYRVELHAQREGMPVEHRYDERVGRRDPYSEDLLRDAAIYCTDHTGTSAILVRTNSEV